MWSMVIPGTEAHGPVDQVKHLQKLKFWTSGTQMTLRSGRIRLTDFQWYCDMHISAHLSPAMAQNSFLFAWIMESLGMSWGFHQSLIKLSLKKQVFSVKI